MAIKGSYGLAIDLGTGRTPAELQALYTAIWERDVFSKSRDLFGEFQGVPRISEGQANIAGQIGQTYTRFDTDPLGYPPGWEISTLLTVSLSGFSPELPENPELHSFLRTVAQACYVLCPFDLALIGDLTLYHINAEFALPEWVDMQGEGILGLLLSARHPLTRQLPGEALESGLVYLPQAQLKAVWTEDSDQDKYQRYKTALSTRLHSETLPLTWEKA